MPAPHKRKVSFKIFSTSAKDCHWSKQELLYHFLLRKPTPEHRGAIPDANKTLSKPLSI